MHVRWAAAALALGALLLAGPTATGAGAEASAGRPTVRALELHGAGDPFIARYLERGIATANKAGDAAVLLTIDTPGGLDSSMRSIIKAITGSRVPVICWTGPAGARAASAGTFVMLACPSNAMAHGTNIGAAHPVGVSGAIEQEKVTNDAAAFIRSLAERTHRNATWAESAVRGTLLLVTSVVAFGILPVQLGGLVLLAASVVLFLVELKHPGVGLPLAGGLACLILGGLLLYDPSTPDVRVSRWLLALLTGVLAGFFGFVVKAVREARALPAPGPGMDALVGAEGVALGELGPRGQVRVGHERWSAEAAGGAIPAGSGVRVVGRRGLRLIVEPGPTVPREATERTVKE